MNHLVAHVIIVVILIYMAITHFISQIVKDEGKHLVAVSCLLCIATAKINNKTRHLLNSKRFPIQLALFTIGNSTCPI